MLCLADRGFAGFPLFSAAQATGADLVWRAKNNAVLPVLETFDDGSFRSELVATPDRHTRTNAMPVRVVEYTITDPGRPDTAERYRLITTILDPAAAPANELAELYAERWEIETALDELKTHQRGPRVVLRSKTPDGAIQEIYGHLCTHYAIRALMSSAADHQQTDPDRIWARSPAACAPPADPPAPGSAPPRQTSPPHCYTPSPRSSTNSYRPDGYAPHHAWSNASCRTTTSNTPNTATGHNPPSHPPTPSTSSHPHN
jgi:hypothetical protein